MIETIRDYGVGDERVLSAMAEVDRAEFVPGEWKWAAYEDRPLPVGYGQTISQPYTVARMCELLIENSKLPKLQNSKVLEVGTGSGYQAAILSRLFAKVYSVELVSELAWRAKLKIRDLKFENVEIKIGDGKKGWPKYAPYDGIIVAANADEVPQVLVDQLAEGGRVVIPVGGEMWRGIKIKGEMKWESCGGFSFVPLV